MLAMSFRSNVEIFKVPPSLIPEKFTFEPYIEILSNIEYLNFFKNSYFIAIIVTLFSLVVASFAGYGFSRFEFKGKKLSNLFIVATQTIPPISLLIPYFGLIVVFKLYNTRLGLILTYNSFCLPYSILMMTGDMNTIPTELDEAILVDGGNRILALFRVILPIAVPGIIATGIYTFMLAWNEFLFALTLTKSIDMRTIPVGISLLMGEHAYKWNLMMSMSILGSLPLLILYLFAQKSFISGLSAGSIKG
jgi:multiple sugar transport system permease protein